LLISSISLLVQDFSGNRTSKGGEANHKERQKHSYSHIDLVY